MVNDHSIEYKGVKCETFSEETAYVRLSVLCWLLVVDYHQKKKKKTKNTVEILNQGDCRQNYLRTLSYDSN